MRRLTSRLAVCLGLLLALFATVALAGPGRCPTCPQCEHKICVPTPEVVKEKKHCWQVECKDICIPAIRWPWQSCCSPRKCGQVKTIKVLEKVDYECEKCGYKWEIKRVGCDCEAGSK